MRHADGHYVWVETTARIAESEAATATQMQTSSRNVEDRVAAQQAQAAAEASRDRAARLFRTAMEHAAIGMAIRDLDGRIVEVTVRRAPCWDVAPRRNGSGVPSAD